MEPKAILVKPCSSTSAYFDGTLNRYRATWGRCIGKSRVVAAVCDALAMAKVDMVNDCPSTAHITAKVYSLITHPQPLNSVPQEGK